MPTHEQIVFCEDLTAERGTHLCPQPNPQTAYVMQELVRFKVQLVQLLKAGLRVGELHPNWSQKY